MLIHQVPRGTAREHGGRREHCPECCSERECVHDGSVCGPEDSSVPGGETWQLQVSGQGYCG